jgi:hypothetical protein
MKSDTLKNVVKIEACNNASMFITADKEFYFTGSINGKTQSLSKKSFNSPVKLISAGKMSLTVVLENE